MKGSSTLLPPVACDTWTLLNGVGAVGQFKGSNSDHWLVRNFAAAGQGGLAYTQGSKDTANPAGGWHYSTNPTPDKDTLENVYAAAYAGGPNKDLMLVFGAERNSVNGDANIGIWFFQQDVHPDPNSNNFVGNHVDKDVFLVSAFTGGGVTPTISIYIWDGTCGGADQAYSSSNPPSSPNLVCAAKSVRYVTSKSALCSGSNASSACAVTNETDISLPWPSIVKSGGTTIPAQTFFTGGIDLSDIFKNVLGVQNLPCFASYLMDTRTSQSLTATLKDFLGGSFPLCGITINKSCQCDLTLNQGVPMPGNTTSTYEYTVGGTVTNTGFGDLANVSVSDKGLSFTLSVLPAGGTKNWGVGAGAGDFVPAAANPHCADGVHQYCFNSLLKPEANVATASAASPTGTPITAMTDGGSGPGSPTACPATADACNLVPGITPSKCCQVIVTSTAQLQILFDGRVTNSGTDALTSLSVQDMPITSGTNVSVSMLSQYSSTGVSKGTCSSCTLLPGDYVLYTGSYTPTAADLTTFPGSAGFSDRLKVTAIRPDTGATITNMDATATCTIALGKACVAP